MRAVFAAAAVLAMLAPSAMQAQTAARVGQAPATTPVVTKQQTPTPQAGEAPPAQGRGAGRPGPSGRGAGGQMPGPAAMGPNQVDQWFDTYLIFQAQSFLNLNDAQWLAFGQKVKNLQTIRRRVQKQRHDTLASLRQMLQAPGALDEAAVTESLRAFDDLSAQAVPEVRQAYVEIDKLLNPRQRVRFRLFEEQMEQKKMELIALARQSQQGRGTPSPQGVIKK